MSKLGDTLHDIVLANERFVLRRLGLQAALISASIAGLVWLPGAWRWAAVVLLVLFLAGFAQLVFFVAAWNRSPLDRPWRAIALGVRRKKEQVLELHAVDGEVLHLPVLLGLVEGVLEVAREEGTTIVREESERVQLTAQSTRLARFGRMETLLAHVPAPVLQDEIRAVFALVGERDPRAANPTLDESLRELEIKLMAEKSAQTTTSLRGPVPVFGKEISALLGQLKNP